MRLCEDWETAKLAERRKAEAEALARARAREEEERRLQDAQAAPQANGQELPPHDPETGEIIELPADDEPEPAPPPARTQVQAAATARRPPSRSRKRSPRSRTSTRCSPSCASGRRSTIACSSWRNAPWMPATRFPA